MSSDETPIMELKRLGQILIVTPRDNVGYNEECCIELRQTVESLMTTTTYKHVVMDLGKLREINSNFLGTLTALLKLSRKQQGSFILTSIHDYVAISMKVSGLTKLFEIHETVEEALQALQEKVS